MAANTLPPSYNSATIPQNPAGTPFRGFVTKCFRVTGILHAVAGGVCTLLGIGAAIMYAYGSFVGIPIWAGLLFFVSTGILGMVYYCKPKNRCIVISYLVMSIISAVLAAGCFITYIAIALNEEFYCDYYYFHGNACLYPRWVKQLLNGILAVIFFLEVGCGITSASVACFKVCRCCRPCCRCCEDTPTQDTIVYYAPQGGAVPMMTLPATQAGGPIYVAGQSAAHVQPGTLMLLSVPNQAQGYVPMQYAGQVPAGSAVQCQGPDQTSSQTPGHLQAQQPIPAQHQQVIQAPLPHQLHQAPVVPGGVIPVQGGSVQTPVPTVQPVSMPAPAPAVYPPLNFAQASATKEEGQTGEWKPATVREQNGETMEDSTGEECFTQLGDQTALI